jgi:IS5 family transposase
MTGELASLAVQAARDAGRLLANARRALRRAQAKAAVLAASGVRDAEAGRRRGRLRRAAGDLARLVTATRQIAAQARQRLAGTMPGGATRRVSLHDAGARPIAKGRLGKPVEFGEKAQVCDNSDGVVVDYEVMLGNPADAPLLAPAVRRIKALLDKVPRLATADRGYGEAKVEAELTELGVKRVVIPRKGKPSAARRKVEWTRGFRNAVKWRTGSEGRIASLKRSFGWGRSLMDGTAGTATWCGWGVFASNAMKIAHLAAERELPPAPERQRPAGERRTSGPPGTPPPPPAPVLAA